MIFTFPAPVDLKKPTLVIGNFDGVHAGHRALLAKARALGKPLAVLTFEPHPRSVLQPGKPFERLMTMEEKLSELATLADAVAVLPFDAAVALWMPEEFIRRVLVDWLGAGTVLVGENFRFGHKAAGDIETLRQNNAFETRVVALVVDENGAVVSSSRLREKA